MWYQLTQAEEIRYTDDEVIITVPAQFPDIIRSKIVSLGETKVIIEEDFRSVKNE